MPNLWNFLVGGALLDQSSDAANGRASVDRRIAAGIAVTPLGLGRSAAYQVGFDAEPSGFGLDAALLCPHYVAERGGLCGIWQHRESTCTTYFCKHVRGAVGEAFWVALKHLLQGAEASLALWCARQLGLAGEMDMGERDDASARALWGAWYGRERQLYEECARLVAALAWADVTKIGGARIGFEVEKTRRAYEALLKNETPQRPTAALVQITPRSTGRARLSTYSAGDALEIPAIVAKLLPYFDGRSIEETLDDIQRREGVRVEPSFVRKLTDFGVLRDAASDAGTMLS
jgi:hypothetical protein